MNSSNPASSELLRLQVDEEHYFLAEHQKRVAFYTSIMTAIVAATIGGAFNADDSTQLWLLEAGPLLLFGVAAIAKDGTFRLYQRFLEAVTMRAKIEQALGLTAARSTNHPDHYWSDEPIVPQRHLSARIASDSSDSFIDKHRRLGYQASTRRLLTMFQALALVLAGGLAFLALGI